jgi:hypothetical protein
VLRLRPGRDEVEGEDVSETRTRLPYNWPNANEWGRWTPHERQHRALSLLSQAVRQEELNAGMPRSTSVRQALWLAQRAFWRDGEDPTDSETWRPPEVPACERWHR